MLVIIEDSEIFNKEERKKSITEFLLIKGKNDHRGTRTLNLWNRNPLRYHCAIRPSTNIPNKRLIIVFYVF